jgi:glycosyltransferase involved in cell wall biosynthesis
MPMRQAQPSMGRILAPPPSTPVEPLAVPPTFSIVVPAYQAAETIGEALRSALGQVHPAHEIIVVDDGSTDDLDRALEEFEGRITLIKKANGGSASAHRAAMAAATGEFVAILDADDAYHPRRLEALAGLASLRPDLDLITTDARFVVGGETVGTFVTHNAFAVSDQRTAIFESCFVGGWPAVRLARLRAIGGFDESFRVAYDWDAWLRLILAGSLAGLVDEPYYDYRLHPDSLTASRTSSLWDRVRLLEKATLDPNLAPGEQQALARSLRAHRTRAVFAETHAALIDRSDRRRLLRFALAANVDTRARLGAALAAPAPFLARRLVQADRPPLERLATVAR